MGYRRREFLTNVAGAGLLGTLPGGQALLAPAAAAKEAKPPPGLVQFSLELEPLVRLIERTPREKCFEVIVDQLRRVSPTGSLWHRFSWLVSATSGRNRLGSSFIAFSSSMRRTN